MKFILFFLFLALLKLSCNSQEKSNWLVSEILFSRGKTGSFDEVSVKDPSIVYFENRWHLFYTARDSGEYTTGYASALTLEKLNEAKRYELKNIRGKNRYGCAPQIFYFEPQKCWYLVFQNRDSNYQPAFSTNQNISNSKQWSKPKILLKKDSPEKWIDFWIIADDELVYLFYTEAHKNIAMRSTSLHNFPEGWSKSKVVFENVHEAAHIYKVKNKSEYHMIYELNTNGIRTFGLARANHLRGLWEKVTEEYATPAQLRYLNKTTPWTEMISHGEAIRSGYNQCLEYNPEDCCWLIQGIINTDTGTKYEQLPWQLGLIRKQAKLEFPENNSD